MNLKLIPLVFCMTAGAAYADCKTNIPADTTSTQFVIGKDAAGTPIVTDNATGLVWQRCSVGQTGDDCSGGKAAEGDMNAAWHAARTAANGWRLPNVKELLSIVDIRCHNPVIDSSVFPYTQTRGKDNIGWYWSASLFAGNNDSGWSSVSNAWGVGFSNGNVSHKSRWEYGFVRLVRGGQ